MCIAMMQSADHREGDDLASIDGLHHRCLYVLGVARSLRGGELPEGRSRPVAGADL